MKRFQVQIVGDTALLQHRFGEAAEANSGKSTRRVQMLDETPRQAAEKVCYRDTEGRYYFPGAAIGRLLREAGGAHKQKGSRKSVKYLVPAAVLVLDDAVTICNGDGVTPVKDFEVDSRPVVIPATKGRVMRHRPRHDKWSANFQIRVNETVLAPDVVHHLLTEGGEQIGIGDFRPEKGGPFGVFRVTRWEEIKT